MTRPTLPKHTRIEVKEYADGTKKYYPQFYRESFFFGGNWFYYYADNEMCEGSHRVSFGSSLKATSFLQQQTLVKTTYLEAQ